MVRASRLFGLVLIVAPLAGAQTVAQVAAQGQCSTAGVAALSRQLVATQECIDPGGFVAVTPHANVTLASTRLFGFMQRSSRDALWAASSSLNLRVNSMYRTLADQYVLYHSGACGLAATPGSSNHQTGRAVDLENWSAALRVMQSAGCAHPYPGSDDVHFDCPGTDRRQWSIRSFQRLWNANNPSDLLDEDGLYGAMTGSRMGRSPASGFARSGCPSAIDAGVSRDASLDVAADRGGDTGVDRPVAADLGRDAGFDAGFDAGPPPEDLGDDGAAGPADVSSDVSPNVSRDVSSEAPRDASEGVDGAAGVDAAGPGWVEGDEGGCGCRAGGASGGARGVLWALAALLGRRRRARNSASPGAVA